MFVSLLSWCEYGNTENSAVRLGDNCMFFENLPALIVDLIISR